MAKRKKTNGANLGFEEKLWATADFAGKPSSKQHATMIGLDPMDCWISSR